MLFWNETFQFVLPAAISLSIHQVEVAVFPPRSRGEILEIPAGSPGSVFPGGNVNPRVEPPLFPLSGGTFEIPGISPLGETWLGFP